MTEAFDPYHKWLGIPPKAQPPDHYRLLGIERFENDPQVIELAASRQTAHVRTFQSGPEAALAQRLLDELAAARHCLLDADRKAEYDAKLQAAMSRAAGQKAGASQSPAVQQQPASAENKSAQSRQQATSSKAVMASVVPTAEYAPAGTIPLAAAPPAAANPVPQPSLPGAAFPSAVPPSLRSRKSNGTPTMVAAAVALVVIGATVLSVLIMQVRDKNAKTLAQHEQVQKERVKAAETPATQRAAATAPPKKRTFLGPPRMPGAQGGTTPAADVSVDPAATVTTPAPQAEVVIPAAKFTAARKAMALRDLETAERELDAARIVCDSVKDQEECSRLEQILSLLQDFWGAVQTGWKSLQVGEELQIGNELFVVVKVEPASLMLKSVDKEATYTLADLPGDLAELLASRELKADAPSTYLCLGAYHALDRFGDREQAPVMWNLAAGAGSSPKLLLPELNKKK